MVFLDIFTFSRFYVGMFRCMSSAFSFHVTDHGPVYFGSICRDKYNWFILHSSAALHLEGKGTSIK
jgi:hypothetical protein